MKWGIGLLFLLGAHLAFADYPQRVAIFFGGNCERPDFHPDYEGNQFLVHMAESASAMHARGWEVHAAYGGDLERCTVSDSAPKCKSAIENNQTLPKDCCFTGVEPNDQTWSGSPVADAVGIPYVKLPEASKQALLNQLNDAAARIQSGGELLLSLSTHGSPRLKGGAHEICLSDGTMMPIDDKDFIAALDALKKKGVKIGILDSSCYSGDSTRVLGKYGCVVTDQESNSISTGSGLTSVLSQINDDPELKGKSLSLEDVFLNYLKSDEISEGNQPQISGYQGMDRVDRDLSRLDSELLFPDVAHNWDPTYDQSWGLACQNANTEFSEVTRLLGSLSTALDDPMVPFQGKKIHLRDLIRQIEKEAALVQKDRKKLDAIRDQEKKINDALEIDPLKFQVPGAFFQFSAQAKKAFLDEANHLASSRLGLTGQQFFPDHAVWNATNALSNQLGNRIPKQEGDYSELSKAILGDLRKLGYRGTIPNDELIQDLEHAIVQSLDQAEQDKYKKARPLLDRQVTLAKQADQLTAQSFTDVGNLQSMMAPLQLYEYFKFRNSVGAASSLKPQGPAPASLRACTEFVIK